MLWQYGSQRAVGLGRLRLTWALVGKVFRLTLAVCVKLLDGLAKGFRMPYYLPYARVLVRLAVKKIIGIKD